MTPRSSGLERTAAAKNGLRWAKRRIKAVLAQPAVSRSVTPIVRLLASRLPVGALLRFPVTRVVEVWPPLCDGPTFLDAAGVDPIASLLYWRGPNGWEPETLPIFLRLVVPGSTVIDVGANTGLFSLLAARRGTGVVVHAVEPVPRVFDMLTANVARNALANVHCHRVAFSDSEGTVPMYIPTEEVPIMASMRSDWRSGSERVDVPAMTLDQFAATLESRIDIVKIDTEGTEPLVLSAAQETLATHRPFIICEVLNAGRTADELSVLMARADYSIFRLGATGPIATDSILGNDPESCRNYLFVPSSRMGQAKDLLGV